MRRLGEGRRAHGGARRGIDDENAEIPVRVGLPPGEVGLRPVLVRISDFDVREADGQVDDGSGEARLIPFAMLVKDLARSRPVGVRRHDDRREGRGEHETRREAAHQFTPLSAKLA